MINKIIRKLSEKKLIKYIDKSQNEHNMTSWIDQLYNQECPSNNAIKLDHLSYHALLISAKRIHHRVGTTSSDSTIGEKRAVTKHHWLCIMLI